MDCQRRKGPQGASGVLSGSILGGMVLYRGGWSSLALQGIYHLGSQALMGSVTTVIRKTLPSHCTSNPSPPGGALAPVENLCEHPPQ